MQEFSGYHASFPAENRQVEFCQGALHAGIWRKRGPGASTAEMLARGLETLELELQTELNLTRRNRW